MMRAALYARVSTRDHEQNPETQLLRLRSYAKAQEWKIYREYVDHASGRADSRPKLDELMIDARNRRFDVILSLRIDRFARSVRNLVNVLYALEQWEIRFVCSEQPIDTESATGKFLIQILGAAAELEGELTRERVIEGLERAKAEGKVLGPPKKGWAVDDIYDLIGENLSPRQIMSKLGMSKSQYYKMLSIKPPL